MSTETARRFRVLLSTASTALVLLPTVALLSGAPTDGWRPVDPADLALKDSIVEKGAPAEVIFWNLDIDDTSSLTVYQNYIRIKIFTSQGADTWGKVQIGYSDSDKVDEIEGRTIKPDGTVIEMRPDAVLEQEVLRARRIKVNAKTFVLPAVEPGCIIEYSWREKRNNSGAFRVDLQKEIPIRSLTYSVTGAPALNQGIFNSAEIGIPQDGRYRILTNTLTDIPAVKSEPYMPPPDSVRMWTLFYYTDWAMRATSRSEAYPARFHKFIESRMKANDAVRRVTQDVIGNSATAEEKLRRLMTYCRDRIKRVDRDAPEFKPGDSSRFKENKSPADTLRQGMGTGRDANLLFAALAAAAGFKSRIALVADRSEILYAPKSIADAFAPYLLSASHIAVLVDKEWRFFDPASVYVPYGMLRWQEEGEMALICDPNEPVIVRTPMSPPEKSLARRTAKLKLEDNGTVVGEVRVETSGHLAVAWKEDHEGQSDAEAAEAIAEQIKARMTLAEVTEVRFEGRSEADRPVVYSYRVRVPAYAEQTGSRLFVRLAYFQRGLDPVFASSERRYPLYFPYPWSDSDEVTIELPAGYQMEHPDAPNPFAVGKDIVYSPKIMVTADQRKMIYQREFLLGGGDGVVWPRDAYVQVKKAFDFVHEADNHTIVLKRQQTSSR